MFYRKGSFNPGEHTTSFAGSREIALKKVSLRTRLELCFQCLQVLLLTGYITTREKLENIHGSI